MAFKQELRPCADILAGIAPQQGVPGPSDASPSMGAGVAQPAFRQLERVWLRYTPWVAACGQARDFALVPAGHEPAPLAQCLEEQTERVQGGCGPEAVDTLFRSTSGYGQRDAVAHAVRRDGEGGLESGETPCARGVSAMVVHVNNGLMAQFARQGPARGPRQQTPYPAPRVRLFARVRQRGSVGREIHEPARKRIALAALYFEPPCVQKREHANGEGGRHDSRNVDAFHRTALYTGVLKEAVQSEAGESALVFAPRVAFFVRGKEHIRAVAQCHARVEEILIDSQTEHRLTSPAFVREE